MNECGIINMQKGNETLEKRGDNDEKIRKSTERC